MKKAIALLLVALMVAALSVGALAGTIKVYDGSSMDGIGYKEEGALMSAPTIADLEEGVKGYRLNTEFWGEWSGAMMELTDAANFSGALDAMTGVKFYWYVPTDADISNGFEVQLCGNTGDDAKWSEGPYEQQYNAETIVNAPIVKVRDNGGKEYYKLAFDITRDPAKVAPPYEHLHIRLTGNYVATLEPTYLGEVIVYEGSPDAAAAAPATSTTPATKPGDSSTVVLFGAFAVLAAASTGIFFMKKATVK